MQGKECEHSELKQELKSGTNRSNACDQKGKWYQIMRNSYVHTFYLPYHFLISTSYHLHYTFRLPVNSNDEVCKCSRVMTTENLQYICTFCGEAEIVMQSAENGHFTIEIEEALYPVKCKKCVKRFADDIMCGDHVKSFHRNNFTQNIVSTLSVVLLKKYLTEQNLCTTGNKSILCSRLENCNYLKANITRIYFNVFLFLIHQLHFLAHTLVHN